jgi:hypothetical protein
MKHNLPVRAFSKGDLVTIKNQSYPYVFKVAGFSRDGKSGLLVNFTSGSAHHKSKHMDDLVLIHVKEAEQLLRIHATNLQEGRFPKGGPAIALAKKFILAKRLQELRAHALEFKKPKFGKKLLPKAPRRARVVAAQKTELDQVVQKLIWNHGLRAFEASVQSFKISVASLLEG